MGKSGSRNDVLCEPRNIPLEQHCTRTSTNNRDLFQMSRPFNIYASNQSTVYVPSAISASLKYDRPYTYPQRVAQEPRCPTNNRSIPGSAEHRRVSKRSISHSKLIPYEAVGCMYTYLSPQNAHIASLNTYLKGIRQAYLSTAPPPRRTGASSKDKQSKYFTDRDREKIDAETQLLIRQLKASIQNLSDAETLRQDTERSLQQRKYARLGLGALGSWASGGIGPKKSFEQTLDESRTNTITQHREAVIWYLNEKLHRCTMIQAGMMEKRLSREMEKNKSALANSRGPMPALGGFDNAPAPPTKYSASTAAHVETQQMYPEEELTPEQIQMFEKENQDMLKHYQTTLDQVRYVGSNVPCGFHAKI